MMQPEGFVDPKGANKVCKLQRSIYGLVQASRSWNKRFDSVIKAFGFIQTFGEACIYKKVSGSSVAFLILYVDDILLIGNDIEFLDSIKGYLNKSFSMKDLGEAAYILGIKIYRDRSLCLICKQLHQGLSLKNSYSSIPLCYPEILYHFQLIIFHPHIISEMLQSSHSLSCKYRLLQKSV